ncbi:hypothetical protein A2U01_0056849, partial [Trifolium medium]|nr:hypothetical protein [Trifolium medium]
FAERMRTITNEQRLQFLAKARQKKSAPEAVVTDPLSQLAVEDEAAKGGKRKRKAETGRVTVPIPNKGEVSTAGCGVKEVQPSPKKHKGLPAPKWSTMGLLSGPNAPSGILGGGDKDAPAAGDDLGVIQPSSSQTA